MTYVYVDIVHLDSRGGEPLSDKEWCSYADIHHSKFVRGFSTDERLGDEVRVDEYIKPGDVVYALVATHSTGDSFGTEYGHISVGLVTQYKERAFETCKRLKARNAVKDDFKRLSEFADIAAPNWEYGYPWDGYFQSLEDLEVRPFVCM